MAKTDITQEQARGLIDRVAQELGLLVADKSGFIKIEGPTNKHRVYVQKSKTLGRIDTTLPLTPTVVDSMGTEQPNELYIGLKAPIGAIVCHVSPTLENLERVLRMLGDESLSIQVSNKPRPFAPTRDPGHGNAKPVPRRVPKAIAPAVEQRAEEFRIDGMTLDERLAHIKMRAREGKINRLLENGQAETREEAEEILDHGLSRKSEVDDVVREAGIEVEQ